MVHGLDSREVMEHGFSTQFSEPEFMEFAEHSVRFLIP
jgi:hypothetical protein